MSDIIAVAVVSSLLALSWLLTVHYLRVRQTLARERSAAFAGGRVDVSKALSRSTYRDLSSMLKDAAEKEHRRVAELVVSFTRRGPLLVKSAATPPEAPRSIRLEFANGWQILLVDMALSTRLRLITAAGTGDLSLTQAEIVETFGVRVKLTWEGGGAPSHTFCEVATLTSPTNRSFI